MKFWMVKGSAGAPTAVHTVKQAAILRMIGVARESGQPAYLLEATMVAEPGPAVERTVNVRDVTDADD